MRKLDTELYAIGTVEKINGNLSVIRVYPEYCDGLFRIQLYSHLIILYWMHERDTKRDRSVLRVRPKKHKDAPEVGVFASRSPSRPNPIGLTVVKLVEVENCRLVVAGLDALLNSPVIDIKPYIPKSDLIQNAKAPSWTRG